MKAYELTSWLEKKYPAAAAEDWDNVGLLTGDDTREISHVFLALDLTEETLAEAVKNGAGYDPDPSSHDFFGKLRKSIIIVLQEERS